jgi:cbb3-type cytochrome c oxidase subunit III
MALRQTCIGLLVSVAGLWQLGRPVLADSSFGPADELTAVLNTLPQRSRGEALYATCAACHGADGAGASDGSVPVIAAQHYRVVAQQLVDYRHGRRWDPRMEHFASQHSLLNAQDLADVAAYVSSLPPAHAATTGDGTYRAYGAKVYASRCASCHGRAAQGNDRQRYPRLAGQHYDYLLRQLHDAVEGRRPNYPSYHIQLFERFQKAEIVGLSDYLSHLQASGPG